MSKQNLENLAKLVRYYILDSTTEAGSGHPSSSLSAVELMVSLMFGGYFKADLKYPQNHNNDRLIFSKGHASPLLYSLYAAAGVVSEKKLKTLRKFKSSLEGHPTMEFPYTEIPTGSLGQGLSVGTGMAVSAKYLEKTNYKTFVLLGDSEMAEGSVWEAMQLASYYKLNNLVAIVDVNRLGQRGETMYGHNTKTYIEKARSFGWDAMGVDGHSFKEVNKAYTQALQNKDKPTMIVAKTLKGRGVSLLEDKNGWHGKALSKKQFEKAVSQLGNANRNVIGKVAKPKSAKNHLKIKKLKPYASAGLYNIGDLVATRKAYGRALLDLASVYPNLVALDSETSNSTYSEKIKEKYPKRFFETFIAEQNMVGMALGMSKRGAIPFASTFAAFFTRAFDQIRMSQYAQANIKFVGSHCGVSIGEDGASQMGLEELAMFRSLLNFVVLYPGDAISTEKLVSEAANHKGNVYIQTTRVETPVIYKKGEKFKIGGSKMVYKSKKDKITVVGAGITLHEAIKAYQELKKENINIRVIDLYSIKPIDKKTLRKAALDTKAIITVEDHFAQGGLGEAVMSALAEDRVPVFALAVRRMPRSGKPEELLSYEEIDAKAIIKKVKEIIKN